MFTRCALEVLGELNHASDCDHPGAAQVGGHAKELETFDSLITQFRSGNLTFRQLVIAVGRLDSKHEDALWAKLGAKVCAKP